MQKLEKNAGLSQAHSVALKKKTSANLDIPGFSKTVAICKLRALRTNLAHREDQLGLHGGKEAKALLMFVVLSSQ